MTRLVLDMLGTLEQAQFSSISMPLIVECRTLVIIVTAALSSYWLCTHLGCLDARAHHLIPPTYDPRKLPCQYSLIEEYVLSHFRDPFVI